MPEDRWKIIKQSIAPEVFIWNCWQPIVEVKKTAFMASLGLARREIKEVVPAYTTLVLHLIWLNSVLLGIYLICKKKTPRDNNTDFRATPHICIKIDNEE